MIVREIMSSDFVKMGPDDTVQEFISAMERYHIHAAPVIDDHGKLLGDVQYKKLAAKGVLDPSTAKVRAIMDPMPPTLKPDTSVEAAADMLFKTGMRSLPVVENGKVTGVISVWDIMEFAGGTKLFRQTAADTIMSKAEVINQDDDIGKARVIMREKGLSRLPVVDNDGKLVGIIAVFDLLRSIKPRERMGWFSMASEVDRIMGCPVRTVMNKNPTTIGPRTSLSEIATLMTQNKTSGIIISEGTTPLGVVTTKDMLEVFVSSLSQKGVYYQIIGLEEEDEMTTNTVDRMIRDTLQKLSSVVPLQFFFIHVKKYSLEGLRIKYSVRARLRTDAGMFMARTVAWDARDAVGQALDNLERILLKNKDEKVTKAKKNARKLKNMKRGL